MVAAQVVNIVVNPLASRVIVWRCTLVWEVAVNQLWESMLVCYETFLGVMFLNDVICSVCIIAVVWCWLMSKVD